MRTAKFFMLRLRSWLMPAYPEPVSFSDSIVS
jgi:hypothetical protein